MALVGFVRLLPLIDRLVMHVLPDTSTQVAQKSAAIYSIMSGRSITITNATNYLAFEGDSITDPTTCAKPCYYWLNNTTISPLVAASQDFGLSGSTIETMTTRASTVDAVYTSRSHNILTILIGANTNSDSPATFEGVLQSYVQARQATGWKVLVATILPQTTANFNSTFRSPVNTWIRANSMGANAIIDVAADSAIGCDACAADTTYYSDGEHPTAAGQAIMAPYWKAAINTALAGP